MIIEHIETSSTSNVFKSSRPWWLLLTQDQDHELGNSSHVLSNNVRRKQQPSYLAS